MLWNHDDSIKISWMGGGAGQGPGSTRGGVAGAGSFVLRGNPGARAGSKAGGVRVGAGVGLEPDCSCQVPNSWGLVKCSRSRLGPWLDILVLGLCSEFLILVWNSGLGLMVQVQVWSLSPSPEFRVMIMVWVWGWNQSWG